MLGLFAFDFWERMELIERELSAEEPFAYSMPVARRPSSRA